MKSTVTTADEYINNLAEDRQQAVNQLREVITQNLPDGFKETISYGMLGYVVPHELYPNGYHCNPELPLPFINLASQKNFIALYHMGIYSNEGLLEWFKAEYPKYCKTKIDMGKSCIRFKKVEQIPYQLIGELAAKMTVNQWIDHYESSVSKK